MLTETSKCNHESTTEYPHQNKACDVWNCDVEECDHCGDFVASGCGMTNENIAERMEIANDVCVIKVSRADAEVVRGYIAELLENSDDMPMYAYDALHSVYEQTLEKE